MPPKKAPAGKPGGKATKGPPGVAAALKARVEAQRKMEEEMARQQEEEERRLKEEMKLAEEQRKQEEEERKLADEQKKVDDRQKKAETKSKSQQEALQRMAAAGMVLPDQEALEAARAGKDNVMAKPAPRPKKQNQQQQQQTLQQQQAAAAAAEALANKKSETDVSSDEDVPAEADDNEVDDWELLEELIEKREAVITRNAAREKRREERAARKAKEEAERKATAAIAAKEEANVLELRSPICCVLGHVDTGKTSLLDKIRSTNVQGGEAGGITQQIGATFFPQENLITSTAELNKKYKYDLRIPGLLVIDTPGHESFTNLRSRGSTLCDIAVLVVDIMHGLEPQTRESMKLLRDRKCPFIVALNKVDRCLDWEPHPGMDIEQTLALQKSHTVQEFETRAADVMTQLMEEGLNSELYWRNKEVRKIISVVPTSAKTGEGISDLLLLEIELVQRFLEGKVAFKNDLQCTVLEVKPVQGIGMTIDVVLVNGVLTEGEKVVLCGLNGPIETSIRSLLTPQPLRELRVKAEYVHHKSIRAAMGVKICAQDLDDVVPGTPMLVYRTEEERIKARKDVMSDLSSILGQVDKSSVGVTVQSSTLGALEALLGFLKDSGIPVSSIALGPLHKKHLQHTMAMKSRNAKYGVVLAFDVSITKDAQEFAAANKLQIFEAKIIYHLFDAFEKHLEKCEEEQRSKDKEVAVFPCAIDKIGTIRDRPMILQGTVSRGQLHLGTPLCTVINDGTEKLPLGIVVSIQRDGKDLNVAPTGTSIAFKIVPAHQSLHFGRQFNEKNVVYSNLTRESIDALKTSFLKQVPPQDWDLIRELKPMLGIAGPATLQK